MSDIFSENEKREILVVLEDADAQTALGQLTRLGSVAQAASPRVVILMSEAGRLEAIRSLPGVASASEGVIDENTLTDLNEQERVFVGAWNLRRRDFSTKQRKGEGKAWDAEGFEPPDLPHKPRGE